MAGAKGRSGGQRSGAGRKGASARILALHGGRSRAAKPAAVVDVADVPMPSLEPSVAAVWAELAPHALTAGTLVPSTVSAFVRVCQAVVKHAKMDEQVEKDGYTYLKVMVDSSGQEHTEVKAHPLIGKAQTLDNHVRSCFKDFGINPFGKPLAQPTKAADPFEEFG